jgi:hypothetical protein
MLVQLEFSFVEQFRSIEYLQQQIKSQINNIFEKMDWKEQMVAYLTEQYRSGGVFIYRQEEPQLTFPHSDYWDCPECEP